ncbi:MAG: DUF3786 domain-containing protein [Candidatus Omnitrophica bacterium]|nr:DUF3786 domain-containing protein [Candidatus Omnitrophota bacterium]
MGYEQALSKSWKDLKKVSDKKNHTVKFLSTNYMIDLEKQKVLSVPSGIPAKDYTSIIAMHYLTKHLEGLRPVSGDWISFKELAGGEGYYPTFKKRVIDVIKEKYGDFPEKLAKLVERFKAKAVQMADISVILEPLEKVPILITMWRGDDEFGPEANVLFDKNIADIFETEDIVVLSEIVAYSI